MYQDIAVPEEMGVVLIELPHRFNQIGSDKIPAIGLCFDLGQIQDATDVFREAFRILQHIADIFDLIGPRQLMLQKRFQIELQGGNRRLQFMGKIIDEFVCEPQPV